MEDDLKRLAIFFADVASNASHFPLTGRMAARLKTTVRRARGPAQPQSRARKRSQGQQKRDRAQRRAQAEAYNEGYARYLQDREDMEAAQAENVARIEGLLAGRSVNHAELVELFTLLGVPQLAAKAEELHQREENPQAILDAAAAAAQIPGQVSVEEAIAMEHGALD